MIFLAKEEKEVGRAEAGDGHPGGAHLLPEAIVSVSLTDGLELQLQSFPTTACASVEERQSGGTGVAKDCWSHFRFL